MLNRWRKELVEQAHQIFARGEIDSQAQQKIADLERLVGQLMLQLEVAKKSRRLGDWRKAGHRKTVASSEVRNVGLALMVNFWLRAVME